MKLNLKFLAARLQSANSILSRSVAFPLLFLGAGLVFLQPCAGAPFVFDNTGSLGAARFFHTATVTVRVFLASWSSNRDVGNRDPSGGRERKHFDQDNNGDGKK